MLVINVVDDVEDVDGRLYYARFACEAKAMAKALVCWVLGAACEAARARDKMHTLLR